MATASTQVSTKWDANLYLKFADARMRPAMDLMARLDPANGERPAHAIYDLGCGAGNIARILAERFPTARWSASTPRRTCWPRRAARPPTRG